MPAHAKAEHSSLRALKQEAVGVRVCSAVPVGRSQKHQNRSAHIQGLAANRAALRHESPGVLHWRIKTRHLFHQRHRQCWRALNLLQQVWPPSERNQRITDQAIEGLMVISRQSAKAFVPNTPSRLQFARTCYDHMAGTLAVQLHDHFIAAGWLTGEGTYQLSPAGETAMLELGIDLPALHAQRRRFACGCLDWSMRRPHLAGALGAALLHSAIRKEWLTQDLDSRALELTPKGRKALVTRFGIQV